MQSLSDLRHDTYHRPEYVALLARRSGAVPSAILVRRGEHTLLVPLLIRRLPQGIGGEGLADAVSPYGYPGPLVSSSADAVNIQRMWGRMVDVAENAGLVSVFVRNHPLLSPVPDSNWSRTENVRHGRVVYVDLAEEMAAIHAQRRSGVEADVRSLRKAGFQAVVDDWDHHERFVELYRETMRRVGADEYYLFEDEYFRGLRDALGPELHLCSVLAPDGRVAAAGLFMERDGLVQYHLSASDSDFRKLAPSKLMLDHMIGWAKERGGTHFHLGGGLGGKEDSLFRFKAGWSDHRRPFHTLRVVPDEARYRSVLKQAGVTEPPSRTGFFPAYRKEG